MIKWTVGYYRTEAGECPIEEFIESKSTNNQAKITGWIEQLEQDGPNLPRPYSDLLRDGIHELRIKLSGDQVRILYFFCYEAQIILTHAIVKRGKEMPDVEIEKAISCREDFLKRIKKEDLEVER